MILGCCAVSSDLYQVSRRELFKEYSHRTTGFKRHQQKLEGNESALHSLLYMLQQKVQNFREQFIKLLFWLSVREFMKIKLEPETCAETNTRVELFCFQLF